MRFKFQNSRYPPDDCRKLVLFAARGIRKDGVTVRIEDATHSMSGLAHGPLNTVTLRLGPRGSIRPVFGSTAKVRQWYPKGIPCRSWKDAMVLLAAHEFQHLWQFSTWGNLHGAEQDAEEYALYRLNAFRVATDSKPFAVPAESNWS